MPQPMPEGGCAKRILPFLLALMLAGCGTNDGAAGTTVSDAAPVPSATTGSTSTTPIQSTTTTAMTPKDGAALLEEALVATGENYRFVSLVEVDQVVVTTIDGRVDGAAVEAVITTGDTQLSYVRTSEGEWTRQADGEWVRLEGDTPVEQPLAPLHEPHEVEVGGESEDTVSLRGRLGPGAGNAAGVEFSTRITGGLIAEISYQAETGGQTATVTTRLTEIGSAGTVEAPTEGT